MTIKRMWINQPSTLQTYHKYHGTLVLVDLTTDTPTAYFVSGDTVSMPVSRGALSDGWPSHLRTGSKPYVPVTREL